MPNYTVRPALPQDGDLIVEVWRSSFGDSVSFVMDFLASTGLAKDAVVAEAEGDLVSMIFAFHGLRIGGKDASYLYAHCTRPEYRNRGIGGDVLKAMAAQCFAQGADMIVLAPAGDRSERWYRSTLGMEVLQRTADVLVRKDPVTSAQCSLIDSGEYAALREGENRVTPQLLAAQGAMHRHYGGVMVRMVLDGKTILACAEPKGSAILVRELLCAPEDIGRAMTVLSAHLWHKETFLRQCAAEGRALLYLTRDGSDAPVRPGPIFPFTLD